jgi:thioredoxin reductase
MDFITEKFLIYGITAIILLMVVLLYILKIRRQTRIADKKIAAAKQEGLFEPVSLHPVVNLDLCLGSGACISACPEKDILGMRNGKATVINASRCIGHGACFHACPTQAISLHIGTEQRGVELPHVNQNFETNVKGIYIAGEMGGMGLIKNAVEQGRQAVTNLAKELTPNGQEEFDLIIVGAGPAGISATLQAKKQGLKTLTLEQDSLGGTVYSFPRKKIVMTSDMELPLHGKLRLYETSKDELLKLWLSVLAKHQIQIQENQKVEQIIREDKAFKILTLTGKIFTTQKILLAIGRRGTPRRLGIPGEDHQKVAYRLLEPERIKHKDIVIVGGGDSAIEAALLLMEENQVTLSYRKETFSRIKQKNTDKIKKALADNKLSTLFNSTLTSIQEDTVTIRITDQQEPFELKNDLVYIFAGGELPVQFLKNAGITITKKYGEAIMKH